jgi:hypothetical protein
MTSKVAANLANTTTSSNRPTNSLPYLKQAIVINCTPGAVVACRLSHRVTCHIPTTVVVITSDLRCDGDM